MENLGCSCGSATAFGCNGGTYTQSYQTFFEGIKCDGSECRKYTNKCPYAVAVNCEMSDNDILRKKIQTTQEAIATLKESTIYSNITKLELFQPTTPEQYKVFFERLSGSELSLAQQKRLLEQIITEFTQDNALNLYMNLINIISKQNKPIDNALLKQIIHEDIHTAITNIMLSYQYQEQFLKFNYSEAYQSFYYASSLYLYNNKNNNILTHILNHYLFIIK